MHSRCILCLVGGVQLVRRRPPFPPLPGYAHVASWLDTIGSWLFKYSPRAFARGEFVTAPVVPAIALVVVAVAVIVLIVVTHARLRTLPVRDRAVLGMLRTLAVLLVIGCLFRPGLVIAAAVPQRNVLAVLFDDSRSMRIADANGSSAASAADTTVTAGSRLAALQRVFADSSALMRELGSRFALRRFRFAAGATPVRTPDDVRASGTRSDLALALHDVRQDLEGMPLAGIVLVTDGADNGRSSMDDALLALRAQRVPVYTVGVGQERFARDVAIERVQAPRRLLSGAAGVVEIDVRLRGVGETRVPLTLEADGRVIATETVQTPTRGDLASVRLRIPPLAPGVHRLALRVRPLADEVVTQNNEWQTSLEVRTGPDRVLYVEGEPRPEFAFLRRAVSDDSAVHVVGLMRSAERKYLRLGVRDSLELLNGFPTTRDELFGYRAIILGSVEAAFFDGEQLRMLADFVSIRGGGLLALGARASLSEGGFAGTPLADVLPLTLTRGDINVDGPALAVQVRPTRAGEVHPALQLRESLGASRARWDSLPPLTIVNQVGALRAGATTLLSGRTDDGRSDVPILAWQRYGRGMSAVFTAQDSWLWRMDAGIAVEDRTHQTFWRQVIRWLVDEVPEPFEVTAIPARVAPGETVTLRAQVATARFDDVNDAEVTATVTGPTGTVETLALEWSLRDDGSYTARFTPRDTGRYTVDALARTSRDSTQAVTTTILVDERGADVAQAELRAPLLRRIADETGGRYYPIDGAAALADDAVYTNAGVTVREAKDLWDMPAVFLLLALLLGIEWGHRRWRGLA